MKRVSFSKILLTLFLLSLILFKKSSSSVVRGKIECPQNLTIAAQMHIFLLKMMGKNELFKNSTNENCSHTRKSSFSESAEDGGYFVTPKHFIQGSLSTTDSPRNFSSGTAAPLRRHGYKIREYNTNIH